MTPGTGPAGPGTGSAGAAVRRGRGGVSTAGVLPAASALAAALLLLGCWIEPAQRSELEQTESGPGLETRVRRALAASAAAWNRGDLEGFMAVYLESPETTYVGGGGLQVGYDAIRQRYAPLFRSGAERDSLRFDELRVRRISGDVAVGTARWVLHRAGRVTGSGPFTLVLRQVRGTWKIVHDHSSADPDGPDAGSEEGSAAGQGGEDGAAGDASGQDGRPADG